MNWYKRHNTPLGVIREVLKDQTDLQAQDTHFSCGGATIQNLFRLLHRKLPSEKVLNHKLNTQPTSGTAPKALETFLQRNKVPYTYYTDQDDVEDILKHGNIIIIEYQDYNNNKNLEDRLAYTSSHFAILAGYDNRFFYIIDSYLPKKMPTKSVIKKVLKNKFLQNWKARSYDKHTLMKRWGLIISVR